jgi:Tol biopolymer transport system component
VDARSELLHILDRALEKDPEDRYQSAHDMLIDLRRLRKDSSRVARQLHFDPPMHAGAPPVTAAEAKKGRSKRIWVSVAGLLVLCAISAVYFLLRTPAVRLNPNRTSVTVHVPFKEIRMSSLSPDGNWIAFPARDKDQKLDIYLMNTGGGEATQIAQGAVPITGPRISADNKVLLYMQMEDIAHIWISAVDGSNAQQVTSPDISVTSASFSLDGKHISYVAKDIDPYNPEVHLYVMDHDGKNQRQLTSGSENVSRGRWSPDGKWLAFLSRALGEPPDSNRICLIQPFNPGPPRLLCKGK